MRARKVGADNADELDRRLFDVTSLIKPAQAAMTQAQTQQKLTGAELMDATGLSRPHGVALRIAGTLRAGDDGIEALRASVAAWTRWSSSRTSA